MRHSRSPAASINTATDKTKTLICRREIVPGPPEGKALTERLVDQRVQALNQSLRRADRSLHRRGIREAHPVCAELREIHAWHDGHAVLLSQVLAQRFGVGPAFGLQ